MISVELACVLITAISLFGFAVMFFKYVALNSEYDTLVTALKKIASRKKAPICAKLANTALHGTTDVPAPKGASYMW